MIFAYIILSFLFALFGGADAIYGPTITYSGPLANLKTGGGITWWNSNGIYSTVHPDPSMCNGHPLGECQICDTSNGYETIMTAPDHTECDDGYYCTYNDYCLSGTCQHGPDSPPACAHALDGFDADCVEAHPYCDEHAETCTAVYETTSTHCDDGFYCTEGTTCDGHGYCNSTSGNLKTCTIAAHMSDDCATATCDLHTDSCVTRFHYGGCDDGNECTGSDACSADPHKLGMCEGLPRFCEPCSECNPSTGLCESDCDSDEICVNDECKDAPPPPECHYDQDCPFPECQGCDAGGHCVEKLNKESCKCALDDNAHCRDCEECSVHSIVDAHAKTITTTCSDVKGQCCHDDHDCATPKCETCDRYGTGFCSEDPAKKHPGGTCACDAHACRDCETCHVTGFDSHGNKEFDCIDENGTCCNSDHDCANESCQTCQHDGTCAFDATKDTCECAPDTCSEDCETCEVTGVDAHGDLMTYCNDQDCTPPPTCNHVADVFCYKGSSMLVCLVLGGPTHAELEAVHDIMEADCMDDGETSPLPFGSLLQAYKPKRKTCARQTCGNGIVVAAAPETASHEECLTPFIDRHDMPCVEETIHTVARYQVCLDDLAYPDILENDQSCEQICGFNGYPCTSQDCPADVPGCHVSDTCLEATTCAHLPVEWM